MQQSLCGRKPTSRAPPTSPTSGLITVAFSAVQMVWLHVFRALDGGYLWVLMAIDLSAAVAAGHFLCRIAIARSHNAYGHGRMAFLGFLPIANLWLLLTPPIDKALPDRTTIARLLLGGFGVMTGLVLFTAGVGIRGYVEAQGDAFEEQALTEPASQQAAIEAMIRAQGLEETLRLMAAETQLPIAIDEVTTLTTIDAAGLQLRRTYVLETEGMVMTETFRTNIHNAICAFPAFEPILRARGSLREVYIERGGREVGSVMVTRHECGL